MKNKIVYSIFFIFGIYCFVLFEYLKPYGELSILHSLIFGFINFITYSSIFFIFRRKLDVISFDGSKFQIILQIFSISFLSSVIVVFTYLSVIGIVKLSMDDFSNVFIDMTLISILPIITGMYFYEKRLLKIRYESINFQEIKENQLPNQITVSSEGQKKALNLNLEKLLLIEGADNYCNVFYIEDGVVKKELFRSTLKNMNDQLQDIDYIFRCHRSYIVNSKNIKDITGKSQAYRIEFEGVKIKVPVSRSFDISVLEK